jgi:phage anti-repressor protein
MLLYEQKLISAKQLHKNLGINRDFSAWIKYSIERAMLDEGIDFTPKKEESTGGRPSIDYILNRDSALNIIVMSGGKNAKKCREIVIKTYKERETGLAHTNQQIEAFIDLSRAMTLVSIQKQVEKRHFDIYNDRYTWYQYRAALLGYDTKDVIKAMQLVNKKHHSMRTSLIQLDANELIRVGVIDFMIALGKNQEYAKNVGDLCKTMAEKMKLGNIIWDDTKSNPLKLNSSDIKDRENSFGKSIQELTE